jgi:hypothetical protein
MSGFIPECAVCRSRRAGLIIIDEAYHCADCVQEMLDKLRALLETETRACDATAKAAQVMDEQLSAKLVRHKGVLRQWAKLFPLSEADPEDIKDMESFTLTALADEVER